MPNNHLNAITNHVKTRPLWSEKADIALRTMRMTQTEFAKRIGLARGTVSMAINTGECSDRVKDLICSTLGI